MSTAINSASTESLSVMHSVQTKSGARHILFCAMSIFVSGAIFAESSQHQSTGFLLCAIVSLVAYVGFWLSMAAHLEEVVTQECLSHPWGEEAKTYLFRQFKLIHALRELDIEHASKIEKKAKARALKESHGNREERARLENHKMLALWEKQQNN
jgi:hypothetical protein